MTIENNVDARITYLHETYGDFPVESATYDLSSNTYERARELHDHGILGAARVWVERDSETLLVREESRPDSWGVAGGLVEPGERTDRAGEREIHEETNVECTVIDVEYVHRATRRHEHGEREAFEEIAVAFIAEYVDGTSQPQEGEIREVKWWAKLPENVHSPADRIGATRLE
jgi:ADP-ribose pyrophosphatase YjhB (NUDIX family)